MFERRFAWEEPVEKASEFEGMPCLARICLAESSESGNEPPL